MPTVTFSGTGAQQTWVVPTGVTSVTVQVDGAGLAARAMRGGRVTGTLAVTPGETLYIYCGGSGTIGSAVSGGFNGGGASGLQQDPNNYPASGCGASDIRQGGNALANRVAVGGGSGGGGGSGNNGIGGDPGYGGAATGSSGGYGYDSSQSVTNGAPGGGGSQSAGGAGGPAASGGNPASGSNGSLGTGGAGGRGNLAVNYGSGGGGGGGYYGGGGGGGAGTTNGAAGGGGGGGGSNYTGGLTNATSVQGVIPGSGDYTGYVSITYTVNVATTLGTVMGNNPFEQNQSVVSGHF